MKKLNIALLQTDIKWHDIESNIDHASSIIGRIKKDTSLIVLPEMFTTGFTMQPNLLELEKNYDRINTMQVWCRNTGADLAAGIVFSENNNYYNRLLWFSPDGSEILKYDKHHLFRLAGEHKIYTPGNDYITPVRDGWRIRPFICYDLRFPVWTRNRKPYYDLLLFIANWPASRQNQWEALLRARAIENQCYVAGVNRTGQDGNGLAYDGGSVVFDFKGDKIIQAGKSEEVVECSLEYDLLADYRELYPFLMDSDNFVLS